MVQPSHIRGVKLVCASLLLYVVLSLQSGTCAVMSVLKSFPCSGPKVEQLVDYYEVLGTPLRAQ